jgi:hypothetical protein
MIIMMIFNLSTSYFHENFVSLFWELFNDGPDLLLKLYIYIYIYIIWISHSNGQGILLLLFEGKYAYLR